MKSTAIEGLDLATATEQDVFDFVVFALIRQGKPARDPAGRCMYRTVGADGAVLKCGVGQVIRDDEYVSGMEGRSLGFLKPSNGVDYVVSLSQMPVFQTTAFRQWLGEDTRRGGLADELQHAHDCANPAEWLAEFRARARRVAEHYGLDDSIVRFREQVTE